jgi:two-component system chemotaxis response regulator CheY
MTTILHVEDDHDLSETVRDYFEALGFRGKYLLATTIEDAKKLLGEPTRLTPIDLVISDMNLPDGTALELVHGVRSDPARSHVPIVILSGASDRRHVDHAYALGANAYISKGARGRSISEVLNALYAHWLRDAHLPAPVVTTRAHKHLARAVRLRTRKAAIDMQIAEQLGRDDGAFWMDLALREGNVANLLAFVLAQLGTREFPDTLLDEAEVVQRGVSESLDELERRPIRTPADAGRYMRTVISSMRVEFVDRFIGQLFPNAPMAMTALREISAMALDEMASWIMAHPSDADLRDQIARLHADAARLRTEP